MRLDKFIVISDRGENHGKHATFNLCKITKDYGAVVLKVNRKIDVAVNKYLKFVWTYLFTATLVLDKSRIRTIFLSEHSTISY